MFITAKEFFLKYSFPITIIVAIWLSFAVGGFVRDGMFMGLISTMALWLLVIRLPVRVKRFMGRHILLSDLVLTLIVFSSFTAFIGPGPTVFMCSVTQATTMSVLLAGLGVQYKQGTQTYRWI